MNNQDSDAVTAWGIEDIETREACLKTAYGLSSGRA
jgi:hypothetical protein